MATMYTKERANVLMNFLNINKNVLETLHRQEEVVSAKIKGRNNKNTNTISIAKQIKNWIHNWESDEIPGNLNNGYYINKKQKKAKKPRGKNLKRSEEKVVINENESDETYIKSVN